MSDRLLRWIGIGTSALVAMLVIRISLSGPVRLEAPKTVVSNGRPPQNQDEPFLLFLAAASIELPKGAEISIFRLPADPDRLQTDYLIALGQLPQCRVVALDPRTLAGVPGAPRYLGVFGDRLEDPRYRLVFEKAGGRIFQRTR
jgi:hypothetical protein